MQEYASEYIVVNAGVAGYTIYEQMLLYNALFYSLKPEIVISCFGAMDVFLGFLGCEKLIKKHKMIYYPDLWEKNYKQQCLSKMPLYNEFKSINGISNKGVGIGDISRAIDERMGQFCNIVQSNGGEFYAFLQPVLACKKQWSKEECLMREREEERFSQTEVYQNEIFLQLPSHIQYVKKHLSHYSFVFDLNTVIEDVNESIFTSNWIHCNSRGNEICALAIKKVLKL